MLLTPHERFGEMSRIPNSWILRRSVFKSQNAEWSAMNPHTGGNGDVRRPAGPAPSVVEAAGRAQADDSGELAVLLLLVLRLIL